MKYTVIIEPPAEDDLERAFLWIAKESRTRAEQWLHSLVKAAKSLEGFPERCSLAPENGAFQKEIRQLMYGKKRGVYRILFTIQHMNVHILHVRHCAQEQIEPDRDSFYSNFLRTKR
ncbi:MAG: type II toxin-antitoxin system RelE/ParE family toxin [Candidatus Hinthialibacter antarcticus]|nr:type II toxin-antitoxin system RelE/ParE family toxin [Candidatus Hinthialibacter antarcticus]